MHWIELNNLEQLNQIRELSRQRPQVIFKHSTRCSVSSMALNRLQRAEVAASADFYLLDLLRFRSVSDQVADDFSVHHESPQVLLIKNGECIYDESHTGIGMTDILEQISLS
ncbi:MAG: bacillithiol system redox-active protein YtxJ [Ferruginibacter sp.]